MKQLITMILERKSPRSHYFKYQLKFMFPATLSLRGRDSILGVMVAVRVPPFPHSFLPSSMMFMGQKHQSSLDDILSSWLSLFLP